MNTCWLACIYKMRNFMKQGYRSFELRQRSDGQYEIFCFIFPNIINKS